MNDNAINLNETLHRQHGPMLTPEILAAILHKPSADAFLQWLKKGRDSDAAAMRKAKRKLGRRVYFFTADIAAILAGDEAAQ